MEFRGIRNFVFALLLVATGIAALSAMNTERQVEVRSEPAGVSTQHDFDFLIGSWHVQHRKLKQRLAHNTEWDTFPGTCETRLVLGGQGDVDDNVLRTPTGTYRAVSLRTFDPQTKKWSIWWVDSRHPHHLDPPVVGTFTNGIGTFTASDTFNGKPIVVRYIWSGITPNSAKWEQAFSEDGGKTWETNWIMEFHRATPARA